jgi:hypothetical protein
MAESEYKYKVLEITQQIVGADNGTSILTVEARGGWDVQQIFSRMVGADSERVFALLRQKRT